MQDFITVHQIQVHLRDGLTITPEIKTMAAQFAEHRSRRPIVAYIDPKNPNQHHLNFADAKLANRLNANDPHMDLRFDNDPLIHKIYTMNGMTPNQLNQDDLNLAKDLWQESLSVELGPDGKPWIDD